MTSARELEAILEATKPRYERVLYFAALLARELQSYVIIVGGSAIEIYTRGGYASGDIDLRADRQKTGRVLDRWGFRVDGRLWIRNDWGIAVDIVGNEYTGDPYRATTVETPFGPVQIAAVEDLLVKRLAEAQHWNVQAALAEAALLWEGYGDAMDVAYLEQQAAAYSVPKLLEMVRETTHPRRAPALDSRSAR